MDEKDAPGLVPENPDIPDEYPSADEAAPEVDDQPLGTERGEDATEDDGPLPGLYPEDKEPPDAG
jgi:hypothetical protein